jgi:hypothetical protein
MIASGACAIADHSGDANFVLANAIRAHGIAVRHEEFDDGHMNITYRYEASLPFLAEAILA